MDQKQDVVPVVLEQVFALQKRLAEIERIAKERRIVYVPRKRNPCEWILLVMGCVLCLLFLFVFLGVTPPK